MKNVKCLEYYLDSKTYSSEEIQRSIEETKKQFPNKKIKVTISINKFDVYIITFQFENKNTYFNKIKIKFGKNFPKKKLLGTSQKEDIKEKQYGQYKSTGKYYKPY